jgi:hypothetical protein
LLDSDNSINFKYVNLIFKLKKWDEDIIYCPEFAQPHFNFREFSGELIDLGKARELLSGQKHNPRFVATLLNTGNYLLNKNRYINCLQKYVKYKIPAGDVLAANYLWLNSGRHLKVLPGLSYNHAVHEGSNFKNRGVPSQDRLRRMRASIIAGEDINFDKYYDMKEGAS